MDRISATLDPLAPTSSRTQAQVRTSYRAQSTITSTLNPFNHNRTRLIDSYFKSSSGSSQESPASPSRTNTLGPSSTPESGPTKSTTEHTHPESIASSDTVEPDALESLVAEPLFNPFDSEAIAESNEINDNHSRYNNRNNNNTHSPSLSVKSPASGTIITTSTAIATDLLQAEDSTPSAIEPIDRLGLLAYSSPLSGESLRRLALSPRKQNRKKVFPQGTMPAPPAVSFADRLAAEMAGSDELRLNSTQNQDISNGNSDIAVLGFGFTKQDAVAKDVVYGSDPESDVDWNDATSRIYPPKVTMKDKTESKPIVLLDSDDDIPTLRSFNSKAAPITLDDSDSDLDEDPFSGGMSSASSPKHITTAPDPSQHDDADDQSSDLSEPDSSSTESATLRGSPTRSRLLTPPRSTRNLRSSNVKPNPPALQPRPTPKPVRAKRPVLFSLDSLLNEKKRKAEVGYDIDAASKSVALDDELLDEYGDDEEEDGTFGPDMIPRGVLSEEQEGALSEIIAEETTALVEDISEFFVYWPVELIVHPLEQELEDSDAADHVVQRVLKSTRTESQRNQFLTSPFLMILSSSPWTMPRSLFRWLVHVVAAEQNQLVALSVFALLQRMLSQKTSLLGVDHEDLMSVFRMYGTKDEYLGQHWSVKPVTRETRNERIILPETAKFPRQNLKAVLKLVNLTATLDPQFYQVDEIRMIVSLLLRMTTDPIIGDIKSVLGSTIVALLDAIPAHAWESEGFAVKPETNYTDLGRRMQVFGFCLDDEQIIASYGRKALEPVLQKLRMMHGRIVDIRAAFMERTLTKDVIQRLYMRLYYAGIHRQTTNQSVLNFAKPAMAKPEADSGRDDALTIADLQLVPELASSNDI
ncbi:hypothetical protein BGZ98_004759 [Dissophora globulifera]|nr:hypothetical protein BGZ98_004759 [Dissophora globulifera]